MSHPCFVDSVGLLGFGWPVDTVVPVDIAVVAEVDMTVGIVDTVVDVVGIGVALVVNNGLLSVWR